MGNLGGGLRNVDWANTKIEHFEKNFYVEDKKVSSRSDREIEDFRRKHVMNVSNFIVNSGNLDVSPFLSLDTRQKCTETCAIIR